MQVEDLFTLAVNARTVDGHVMQSGDQLAIDGHGDHEVGYEAHARVRSVLRRVGPTGDAVAAAPEPAERRLALALDGYGAALVVALDTVELHRLATYLFGLAQAFSDFYEACPVLRAPDDATRARRALLCRLTGDTLAAGLGLLGIAAPDRL